MKCIYTGARISVNGVVFCGDLYLTEQGTYSARLAKEEWPGEPEISFTGVCTSVVRGYTQIMAYDYVEFTDAASNEIHRRSSGHRVGDHLIAR